ncbi:MAG: hypothetical protein GF411_17335 [Candidatus Lokiarchaeota archaeon]|nr:hypothetical protein [Candidatus Lokiarchaeota archaeon]
MSEDRHITSLDDVLFLTIPNIEQDFLMNKVTIDSTYIHALTSNGRFVSWTCNDLLHFKTTKFDSSIPLISIVSDEDYVYLGSGYRTPDVYICHMSDHQQFTKLSGHTNSILDMAIDSSFLYTGSADGTVKMWEKNTWSMMYTLKVQEYFVLSISIDSKHIFAGGLDRMTRVFLKSDYTHVATLQGHEASVFTLSADDDYVYSGSGEIMWGGPGAPRPSLFESALRVWDKTKWMCIATKSEHSDNINGIAVDIEYIYTISDDCTLRIYQKDNFEAVGVLTLGFIPKDLTQDSTRLFIAGSNGKICVISKHSLCEP